MSDKIEGATVLAIAPNSNGKAFPVKPPQYTSLPIHFWDKVEDSPDKNGCWLWRSTTRGGYGRYWHAGAHLTAHRLAAADAKGPIPTGVLALHNCDVRNCVNPGHIYYGTYQDNVYEKKTPGKNGKQYRECVECRGVRAPGKRKVHAASRMLSRSSYAVPLLDVSKLTNCPRCDGLLEWRDWPTEDPHCVSCGWNGSLAKVVEAT